jgi:hypothetical protein
LSTENQESHNISLIAFNAATAPVDYLNDYMNAMLHKQNRTELSSQILQTLFLNDRPVSGNKAERNAQTFPQLLLLCPLQ